MESWRQVWREGYAPVLTAAQLERLAEALRADDPRLIQSGTTVPPPLMCVFDWPVEAGCALAFVGAGEHGGFVCTADESRAARLGAPPRSNPRAATVDQVVGFFSRVCSAAAQRFTEPGLHRHFLNWFDDTPRAEMRRELLAEVELALAGRAAAR